MCVSPSVNLAMGLRKWCSRLSRVTYSSSTLSVELEAERDDSLLSLVLLSDVLLSDELLWSVELDLSVSSSELSSLSTGKST